MLFLLIGWQYNKVEFDLSFLLSAFRLFERQIIMLKAGAFCLQFAFSVVSGEFNLDEVPFDYSFILNSLIVPVSEENTVPTLKSLRVSAS